MALVNAYATLAQLKSSTGITDTFDDSTLTLALNAASREIDQACERVFYPTTTTRLYIPRDSATVEIDDLETLTTLKTSSKADGVFDTTWTAGDIQLEPLNKLAGGITTPFTLIRAIGDYAFPITGRLGLPQQEATVQITGVFGFNATPVAITQATIILASRIFKRNDSPLGFAGIGDMGVMRVSRFDPDIDALIAPYKRVRFA
jgi:hypothetical protein